MRGRPAETDDRRTAPRTSCRWKTETGAPGERGWQTPVLLSFALADKTARQVVAGVVRPDCGSKYGDPSRAISQRATRDAAFVFGHGNPIVLTAPAGVPPCAVPAPGRQRWRRSARHTKYFRVSRGPAPAAQRVG